MALCPLAAPGAQADIKHHVWRLLRKLRAARAETAEAAAAAAPDIVKSSNLRRAAAAYCLDVTVDRQDEPKSETCTDHAKRGSTASREL